MKKRLLLVALSALMLAACGGNTGGSRPVPRPTPVDTDTRPGGTGVDVGLITLEHLTDYKLGTECSFKAYYTGCYEGNSYDGMFFADGDYSVSIYGVFPVDPTWVKGETLVLIEGAVIDEYSNLLQVRLKNYVNSEPDFYGDGTTPDEWDADKIAKDNQVKENNIASLRQSVTVIDESDPENVSIVKPFRAEITAAQVRDYVTSCTAKNVDKRSLNKWVSVTGEVTDIRTYSVTNPPVEAQFEGADTTFTVTIREGSTSQAVQVYAKTKINAEHGFKQGSDSRSLFEAVKFGATVRLECHTSVINTTFQLVAPIVIEL